ncbi:MAG: efflux RND transporter periplasmic adaptor subunit [Planctomycetes bacterium]|nr:efflux RND transporter periplasmic adaptor subunit [Planctomycetota bacterium]
MKRPLRILLVLLVVAAGLWLFRARLFGAEAVAVRTARVARGVVEESVTNSKAGTVEARRRSKLSPGTSGVVAEVRVERGQRVAQGEALVVLADDAQRAQLLLAQRALEVAEATHVRACIAAERAERELSRNQDLAEKGIVSGDALDQLASSRDLARASCSVVAAEVEHARAAVVAAQTELDKTILRSPFDGIVAEVPVQLGEWATPSVALVAAPHAVDVIDPASIYIAAPMDEVDSERLAVGLATKVTLDAFPGRAFAGRVVRVAPYVLDLESQNRTVEIEVELDDVDFGARLLPGTSADVEVVLRTRTDVPRIPTGALLEGGRVLVLQDGRLIERQIVAGLRNWDWTEVVSGLAEGDAVVVSLDSAAVRAGARAVLKDPP